MKGYKDIDDKEIHNLLQKRLLEQDDNALLEAEAKLVFSAELLVAPSIKKEKKLIEKLTKRKSIQKFKKWMLPGASVIAVLSALTYYAFNKTNAIAISGKNNDNTLQQKINKVVSNDNYIMPINESDTVKSIFINNFYGKNKYHGQIVEKILKENADCTNPVLITDTVIFCPNTPKGKGNEIEIFDNKPDDQLYFETEHNTIWYKFIASQTGQFTFDLIPESKDDDYDFMLFKYTGGNFQSKIINKQVKPVRTCISRNDKKINGMTGLFIDLELPLYVHSGEGVSYVKYINVQKGETYYLLVDNVYNKGNGHTILLHYKPFKQGELYVGQKNVLTNVTFKDSDDEFRPGTKYVEAIDSLYKFLSDNPGIKMEIQGHVNASAGNSPTQISGKPQHTDLELSQLRAEAVCKILYKKGVDPERLIPQGYAGTRKKIALPKTKEECYMNIRIEVLILSLDYKNEPAYIKKHRPIQANQKR